MRSVSFALFYNAVKDRLTREQFQGLNPEISYYEDGNSWFGIGFSDDMKAAWVSIAVGKGPRFFWAIKKHLASNSVERIGWLCREGSAPYAIARYYKAEIKSEEFYENGQPAFECWANVKGGRNGRHSQTNAARNLEAVPSH